MLCNAGRNYLFVERDGAVHRCRHRASLGVDESWSWSEAVITDGPAPCDLCDLCASTHPFDYERSSRFDESSQRFVSGSLACDPRSHLVTALNLEGGDGSISPDGWIALVERFAKAHSLCWHTITASDDEPLAYKGIAKVVDKMMFLGDRVCILSNMSVREPVIVDVLRASKIGKMRFECVLDTTSPRFDWLKFLGRSRLVGERGFDVKVVFLAKPLQMDQYERYREKFLAYGIRTVLRRVPGVSLGERHEEMFSRFAKQDADPSFRGISSSESFEGV